MKDIQRTSSRRTLTPWQGSLWPLFVVLVAGMLVPQTGVAGKYNKVLSVGETGPAWTDLPGTDGAEHSLQDLADTPVVVVAFTCLSCPTALDYEPRINELARKYGGESGKVAFVVICVNRIEADRLPALSAHVKEHDLHFAFLHDESQQIARDYGAIYTPQFFVLNQDRKITYMGALDDATEADQVTRSYLDEAIRATLEGATPEIEETVPRGCTIRYQRDRQQRRVKSAED